MPDAWEPLLTGLLAIAALGLCVSAVCHALMWYVVRHRPRAAATPDKVTILRPLCGVDACMLENLRACAQQSHRQLNIVLGIADQADEALPVAVRFSREQRDVPIRVSVGEDESLENPKVALLERMSWQ